MGNFVSKPPFDLTEFLSKPASLKGGNRRRFGNANFSPRAKTEETPEPVEAKPEE
jgi:hypothetical protein